MAPKPARSGEGSSPSVRRASAADGAHAASGRNAFQAPAASAAPASTAMRAVASRPCAKTSRRVSSVATPAGNRSGCCTMSAGRSAQATHTPRKLTVNTQAASGQASKLRPVIRV